MRRLLAAVLFAASIPVMLPTPVAAQSSDQRKELLQIRREVGQVTRLIRDDKFDEAQKILDDATAKLNTIAQDVGVEPGDRRMLGVSTAIEQRAKALEIARARKEGRDPKLGVSFSSEVAPIIADNCLRCHSGANPRANLNLSTFAGWKRGGDGGPLLLPGNAQRSLLIARLITTNQQARMPRNADPLSADQIRTIGKWIEEGAKYDAEDDDIALADLGKAAEMADDPSIVIPRPTGSETVSFTRDIAPFMSNLCVRCHNDNRRSGGLSLVSFHDMMKGGDSGRVVLPGNREGSRLFRLTGGLENPRMPNDPQVRITRENYENLKTWFDEGNTFDGDDPKTPLRVYAQAAMSAAPDALANLSKEEFNKLRSDKTEQQWKRAVPSDPYRTVESDDFLIIGNVPADRLETVNGWAQDHLKTLKELFGGGSGQAWKGRLAIFIMKDRFGYEEFNQTVNNRRAPREMFGHSVVTPDYADAYLVLQDVGDTATGDFGGLQISLIDHMTAAYLQREGARIPDWIARGTGLALAANAQPSNDYLRGLDLLAGEATRGLLDPQSLFTDGTFSPATIGPVGYSLVRYMIGAGGSAKFGTFISQLRSGKSAAEAVRAVYGADLDALGRGFLNQLGQKRR